MNIFSLLSLIVFLVYLEVGLFILLRSPRARINQAFFYLSMCFSIWSFAYIFVFSAPSAETAVLWDKVASLGYTVLPGFMIWFISTLTGIPQSERLQNLISGAFFLIGVFFLLSVLLAWWPADQVILGRYTWIFLPGKHVNFTLVFFAYYFLAFAITLVIMLYWRKQLSLKLDVFQFRIIFYPLLLFAIWGFLTNVVMPLLQYTDIPGMGHIASFFWVAGIAFGIVRLRLLNPIHDILAEQVVSQVNEIVIISDLHTRIIGSNKFTAQLLKQQDEHIRGKTVAGLFSDKTLINNLLEKMRHKHYLGPVNTYLETDGGQTIEVSIYLQSIIDNYNDMQGVIIYGHDNREAINLRNEITIRQRAEENLRSISEVLEVRVRERTRELADSYKELQLKITERMRVEEQIKADIAEKEVLINEIHNRVKNNMNMIIALIQTQNRKNTNAKASLKFQELAQRVRSILLVHQNLYLSITYSDVDFANFLRILSKELLAFYGKEHKVELRTEFSNVFLDIDYAIPLGIVVNELMSNAIRHGFSNQFLAANKARSPILYVQYTAEAGVYEITINDNGKGLPKGFNISDLQTNGLQLVEILVQDQINGELDIQSSSHGSMIRIRFKAAK